jgi:hypothetical protein
MISQAAGAARSVEQMLMFSVGLRDHIVVLVQAELGVIPSVSVGRRCPNRRCGGDEPPLLVGHANRR